MRISALTRLAAGGFLAASAAFLANCTSSPKSEVVVSVKEQKLGIYEAGQLKREYAISTSKFGLGDQPNSYRTPLGKHEVVAKIGHGLPKGAVLKSRSWNGEVLKPNAPGRDPIVSRILWLRGLEKDNKNAQSRFIYIHGTTEECNLGKPASYGCIRMGMSDVVDVFNEVSIGAKVVVTKGGLPSGGKAPKPVEDVPELEPAASNEPILIADVKAAPDSEPSARNADVSTPTPVEANPDKPKGSKTFFGLFGKKRSQEAPAPEAVAADASAKAKERSSAGEEPLKQVKIGPDAPVRKKLATKPAPAKATANKKTTARTGKA